MYANLRQVICELLEDPEQTIQSICFRIYSISTNVIAVRNNIRASCIFFICKNIIEFFKNQVQVKFFSGPNYRQQVCIYLPF